MNVTTHSRYEQYELRMRALGRILDWIILHKILLISAAAACVAILLFLAIVPGIFVGEMICPDFAYGDASQHEIKAILSDVSYEFSTMDEGALWSESVPTRTGTYRVRGVSKNGYGKIRYSKEMVFTIYPAKLEVVVRERSKIYGEVADYSLEDLDVNGLAEGDQLAQIEFFTEDVSLKEMLVGVSGFIVVNANGEDVTDCYSPTTVPGALHFEQRVIVLASEDETKPYDGKSLSKPTCELIEGSLAAGDQIEFSHDPSSVITEPGSIEAKFTATVTDSLGRDVTDNYKINYKYGKLTVNPRPLTVGIPDAVKNYDGRPLTVPEFSITSGSLVDGASIELQYEGETSITKVGALKVLFKARIYDPSGRDLTDLYALNYVYPTLTVRPCPILVASTDLSKIYDGNPLTGAQPIIISGSLVDGDVMNHTLDPASTVTDVGQTEAKFTVTIADAAGNDVSDQYSISYQYGKLTVEKRPITVLSASSKKVYDGTPLKNEKYSIVSGTLVKNHSLAVVSATEYTNAGKYDNILSFSVKTKDGLDVTANYEVTVNYGVLEVQYREITVRAENAKKVYDGTPLTSNKWKLSKGSLAKGQSISVSLKGSQTDAGKSDNVPTVVITDQSGNNVTDLGYRITIQNGKLEVTPRSITITSESDSKVYDGKPLTNDTVTCTAGNLVLDHAINAEVTGSQTEIGESSNYFSVKILTKNKTDVTRNYSIQKKYGTLKVTPRGGGGGGSSSGGNQKDSTELNIPKFDKIYTVFEVMFTNGGSTFLRHKSYGDYTGTGFLEAPTYVATEYSPLIFAARNLSASGKVEYQSLYIYRSSDPGYDLWPYYANSTLSKVKNDNIVDSFSRNYTARVATGYDYRAFEGITCSNNYKAEEAKYRTFVHENYLYVPESTRKALQTLADKNGISRDSKTLIKDIQTYVKKAAKYNLKAAPYPKGVDQVVYFLTVAKEGVCQQYAASATMLYRMFGIPARYTVGYSVHGEAGVRTEVTNDMAHAWVEIYLDGIGWVAVEVTPSAGGGGGGGEGDEGEGGGGCDGDCSGNCEGVDIGQGMDKLDNLTYARVSVQKQTVLYLRETSYGNYTGTGWTHATPYATKSRKPIYFAGEALATTKKVPLQRVSIRLNPGTPYLLPYYLTDANSSAINETDIDVEFRSSFYNLNTYTGAKYSDFENATGTVANKNDESKYRTYVYNNYLDIPASTKTEMLKIAKQNGLSANSKTIITDVQNFIRNSATYNLEVGDFPEGVDVAVYFLTVAKEGYCQHFATAATLMYRALGIPARYTCGFMMEMQEVNTFVPVKGENAHAWVEVYVDGIGWVQIEATAVLEGSPTTVDGVEVFVRPDGKISVGAATISAEKEYDGMPFDESIAGSYYLTKGNLLPGHRLVVKYSSNDRRTTPQTFDNTVDSFQVFDKNGKDVTEKYVIDWDYGSLSIKQRHITISSIDATKPYDGLPLDGDSWWLSSGSLAKGDKLEVVFTGKITDVGTAVNSFIYYIYDSTGKSATYYYSIETDFGQLQIIPSE